jgi:hydrogenase-4 component F
MLAGFLASPFVAALIAAVLPGYRSRFALLVGFGLAHLAVVASFWTGRPDPVGGEMLVLDDLGLLFLTVTAVLFALVSLYAPAYLAREEHRANRVFTLCAMAFLGAMDVVCCTRHLGLFWVAVEATTLASAPLIAHPVNPRGLEATWKYLVLCSVGIAVALLGTFFLGLSALEAGNGAIDFTVPALRAAAPQLSVPWLKGSFVLLLVGYGTKMGLAPMHSWLPDAHSEAPSPVSALLSGALLNCAFLGLLRVFPIVAAAGLGEFARELFTALGIVSLAVAAVFVLGQTDIKRMLAYSSIEHMGVIALGVGVGGIGSYGALLHAVNHSITKALLFLAAGNILVLYGTKTVGQLSGVVRRTPWTGALFPAGIFAIAGFPPFGVFLSEFTILRAIMDHGHSWLAAAYLTLLGAVFVGLASVALRIIQGEPPEALGPAREPIALLVPPALLGTAALALGLLVPGPLETLLRGAARTLGG